MKLVAFVLPFGRSRQSLLPLLLLFTLPAVVQAQFQFITNNGVITITKYTGSGGAVIIPSMTNGYPVACIQGYALSNCPFTSVWIPNSVTNIGEGAFASCPFLTNVTLPNSLTSIADSLFAHCPSLTGVTIPRGVTSIGLYAFAVCGSLSNVMIAASVTNIGQYAFAHCPSLTGVTIPRGVTSIGLYAFAVCGSLSNVMIAASVTNIGQYAFQSCTGLRGVYCQGNAPSAYSNVFYDDNYVTVYYLPGTTGWDKWVSPPPAVLWDPLMQAKGPGFGVHRS